MGKIRLGEITSKTSALETYGDKEKCKSQKRQGRFSEMDWKALFPNRTRNMYLENSRTVTG